MAHGGVPHRHGFFGQADAVEPADLGEQAGEHFIDGEVFFDFGFAEGILGLAQFFRSVGQIPGLGVGNAQLRRGKGAHFGQVALGKGLGAAGKAVEKLEHLGGGVGHFGGERKFGVVGIAQQPRFFQGDFQAAGDVGTVVEFAVVVQFAGAGKVGAVNLLAQLAALGILHHGNVVRHLQANFVAAFAFGLGGSLKHCQRVVGNA